MEHKIINNGQYLLVVSEQPLTSEPKNIPVYGIKYNGIVRFSEMWKPMMNDLFEILAHLPLSNQPTIEGISPILEGIDLLPPLEQEDDVEKMAQQIYPQGKTLNVDYISASERSAFINGYNKAKEKYKYTEEDLGLFLEYVRDNYTGMGTPHLVHNKEGQRKTKAIVQDYIQSLSQPKLPVAFECEIVSKKEGTIMLIPPCKHCIKPKTTTNSQGQTVWVGKYIY